MKGLNGRVAGALRPCVAEVLLGVALAARASAGPNPEQAAFAPDLEVVDAPTASVAYARMFGLNVRMFRGGGIVAKATATFNNSLQLGAGIKAANVIGSGNVAFDDQTEQVVAALVRLRVINLTGPQLQVSIGYDGMGYDVTRKHGLYAVASKDLGAAGLVFRGHAGAGAVRFRGFDTRNDLNLFAGLSAALSEEIRLGVEYDDIVHDDGIGKGYFNAGVAYAWDVGLRLELDLKALFRGTGPTGYHRVLKILYTF